MPPTNSLLKNIALYIALIGFLLTINSNNVSADAFFNFSLPPVTNNPQAQVAPQDKAVSFITYDNADYSQNQNIAKALTEVSNQPEIYEPARLLPNGNLVIHISPDGHYYIPAAINGYPFRLMVDSGAAYSSVKVGVAKNAGIKAGIAQLINTANGQVTAGLSSGNVITIANAKIANAHVLVMDQLQTSLLGSEVLNALDISYSEGVMTIKAIVKNKLNTTTKN